MEDSNFEIIEVGKSDSGRPIGQIPTGITVFTVAKGKMMPTASFVPPEVRNSATKLGCLFPPIERTLPSTLEKADPTHKTALDVKSIATSQKGYKYTGGGNKFKKFEKKPNYETFTPLQDIVDAFVYEYYVYDEAYLEILKIADKISMFICPARYIYTKVNEAGRIVKYCFITNGGDITEMEPYRGGELKNGIRYCVSMRNYNTTSYYYGFPAYMSAIEAMIENSFIRRFGIKYFENDATPSKALVLSGAMLSSENKQALNSYLSNNLKGVDNSHRLLVLTLDDLDAKAVFQDLSKNIDGSFLDEYKKNRDEIVTCHQVPPKLLGVSVPSGLSSGSETIGSLRDFVDRTIAPRQKRFSLFFSTLFSEMFNTEIIFNLEKIDTTDMKDEAIVNNIYANLQDADGKPVKTVTEIREEIGMKKEPEGAFNAPKQQPQDNKTPNGSRIPGMNTFENPDDLDTTRSQ